LTTSLAGRSVLVTGGAGFIGSHLVAGLVDAGARVRVFDDLSTGKPENLAGLSEVELVVGDVRDAAACRAACAGVSVVFHEAAIC
jgi:UDP-glucose 4-epimerase